MPYIKSLKDKSGVSFYPQTVMQAVYDGETGKPLSNGIPASRYQSLTVDAPVSDSSHTGYTYAQTFAWENVLPAYEATAQVISGHDPDDDIAVETLTDAVKLYFGTDPTGAVVRVRVYPSTTGTLYEDQAAILDGRVAILDGRVGVLEERCDYSTEEQVVGKWIDGKPVYQITEVITIPNIAVNTRQWVYGNKNIPNIDTVIYIGGSITSKDNTVWSLIGYRDGGSNGSYAGLSCIPDGNNSKIGIVARDSADANYYTRACVTLRYTKTTD